MSIDGERDRGLAAERTTLAWRRSGVSLLAVGLAVGRGLGAQSTVDARPAVGIVVSAMGVAAFLISLRQASIRARFTGSDRPTARLVDLAPLTFTTALIAIVSIILIIAGL
ncbi:MAG: DUF202 domain-containing protein [Acidimicrobiales bacterium]